MAKRIFKSKKKLSSVKAVYRKWSDWETGDILIGTFKGTQVDGYEKDNYLVEVEDAQFADKKAVKKLMTVGDDDEKVIIGLNHTGKLANAMKSAEVGDIIQVEYKGMEKMTKGKFKGKDVHDMDVDVVEEDDGDEDEDEDIEDDEESDDSDDESDDDDDDL